MQFQQSLHTRRHENGRISTIRFHNLKYLEGNCMQNLSPGDERQPQGLRAHIHTFTMRAFSDSSAKSSPSTPPSAASPVQNSPSIPPPTPHPIQNSPNSPFPTACAGQNSPNSSFPTACAGQNSPNTKHTGPLRYKTRPAHPFTLHARYKTRPARPKWPNMARFNRAWRTFYRCHHQQATQGELFHAHTHTRPSRRIPLASSAAFEARHTATDLYTPIMAAPLISREDQHTAADLCTHDPAIVVDTGDHRQDRIERKNAHA